MADKIDTIIVGGGQAGLTMSYCLSQLGREHLILERSRLAERWRSERWDSLAFQFPNWSLALPGFAHDTNELDGFAHRDAIVAFLEQYASLIRAPAELGVAVRTIRSSESPIYPFLIETDRGNFQSRNLVLATGPFQKPSIPACGALLPNEIMQIHTRDYRNPDQLPQGPVLVVGGGNSGTEIALELHRSRRKVYLSMGSYRKAPRRYRGRDFRWWIDELKLWDRPIELCVGLQKEPVPLLTGLDGGCDIDLRRISQTGIQLLGRLCEVSEGRMIFAPDLEENLSAGEAWFSRFKQMADDYVEYTGLDIAEDAGCGGAQENDRKSTTTFIELNLRDAAIAAVVWATGYRYDFDWIKFPVLDAGGTPIQVRGVTKIPGLYFLGLRRMHTIKSALLSKDGVGADAAYIAERISNGDSLQRPRASSTMFGKMTSAH